MKILFAGDAARGIKEFLAKQARLDELPEGQWADPKFVHIEFDGRGEAHVEMIVRTVRGEGQVSFNPKGRPKKITELR